MLRHHLSRRASVALCLFCVWLSYTTPTLGGPIAVPSELEAWRGWVLQDQEYRQCPLRVGVSSSYRNAYLCAWPERLTLALDAHAGTFSQRWQIGAESWVRLPGNVEHWPQDVRVDGEPGQVVLRLGTPQVLLQHGDHTLSGRFRFAARPEQLPIDSRTAMVELQLDGRKVSQPERPGGEVWLGGRRNADQPRLLLVEVYRLVEDRIPVILTTDIRLQVSGDGREELLSRALPDGFVPLSLDSEIPVRIEPDGRLRVQVRPGTWDIKIEARGATVASRLTRPPVQGNWARDEVWSFAASDRLRVAAAQGPEGIDPTRAGVPADWREYPAYRMAPDSVLNIVERTRGLGNTDENSLSLTRELWLDFDGGGFTARDHLKGKMRQGWRLETAAPVDLESVTSADENLLVTLNDDGKGTGVEVRAPQLDLTAVSRIPQASGSLPASGWNERFQNVHGALFLPPGHLLLGAIGVDSAPEAWIETWGLWAVFGVLVVAISAGWIAGKPAGIAALVGLLLLFRDGPGYIWLWGNLIVALALARAAPEGRLKTMAARYRLVSLVVLGLALAPFFLDQLRFALHPQLAPLVQTAASLAQPGVPVVNADGSTSVENPYGLGALWEESPTDKLMSYLTGGKRAVPPALQAKAALATEPAAAAPPVSAAISEERKSRVLKRMESPTTVADVAAPAGDLEEVTVTGATRRNPLAQDVDQRYATGTQLQAGPGVPRWRYNQYGFFWTGPVEAAERVHFIFIGPVLLGVWRILGVVLLTALFAILALNGRSGGLPAGLAWPPGLLSRWRGSSVAALILAVACSGFSSHLHAASTPDGAILDQLGQRLTKPPTCVPTCADITSANVAVHDQHLDVTLTVSALASVAVPMPFAGDRWQVDSVTLDGRSALAAARNEDGAASLSVPLSAGVHTVHLAGQLAAAESISLAFPLSPHRVTVESTGWDVTGLNDEQRILSGSIELRRRAAAANVGALETSAEFPTFVRVRREVSFALDWTVRTTVERVAPAKAAINVEIPLLDKESVLTQKLETRTVDGHVVAVVALARGEDSVEWTSSLPRSATLQLSMPQGQPRSEVWSFDVAPQWSVAFEGFPAVMPEDARDDSWIFEFHPRPGETLKLQVDRPQSAGGTTLAVDSVMERLTVGARSTDGSLEVRYRSTMGGRHAFKLPPEARVTRVTLDETELQLRPDHGELPIGLLPGAHVIGISWTTQKAVGVISRVPAIDLGGPASNVAARIALPQDRWPLFAAGQGEGPAVLYWADIVIFLAVAWVLGRLPRSPLRTNEWLILGVGLSTLSWTVFVVVALWLFAMQWRARWSPGASRWQFNLVQVALAVFTAYAVCVLVFVGIHRSLLSSPDMGIVGEGSFGTTLQWFLDRTISELPRPVVVSAPMWLYRTLMFAWALWIVVALLRWLRWAWGAWKTNGIWKGPPTKPPT